MATNRFLDQLKQYDEAEKEQTTYENNRFLRSIPEEKREYKSPWLNRAIEATKKFAVDLAKSSPRLGMQGAIGSAKGAAFLNPVTAGPAILAELGVPGAIQQTLHEEEEFQRDLPPKLKEALDLPEFKPEVAKEASRRLYEKATGGEGVVGGLITAPFRLAGIETKPQTGTETATRNVSELAAGFRNPKQFTNLVFDYLPNELKNFFKNKMNILEEMLIGKRPIDESIFQTAEQVIKDLTEQEAPRSLQGRITPGEDVGLRPQAIGREAEPSRIQIPEGTEQPSPSLRGRVTEGGTRLRAISPEMQQTLEPIGQIVSPQRFNNDEVAGNTFRQIIQNDAAVGRDAIREAYELAEQEYNHVVDAYPQLINRLQTLRSSLLESGSLNPAQEAVVRELDNILGLISTEEGTAIEIPVRRLIRTSDSITGRLTQEDIYGDARTLLRGIGHDLNQAALQSVERVGGNPEAIQNADRIYSQWADRFSNDEIAPFLTRRTFNPEEEYEKAISDRGTFRAIENAIGTTPQGTAAISSLERDIVEKELEPFVKNPEKIGSRQYEKVIENLRPIVGNEHTNLIDQRLSATRTAHTERKMPKREITVEAPKKPFKAEKRAIGRPQVVPHPEVKPTTSQTIAAKYIEKKPEDIQKMLSTRSGLRELKKDLIDKKGKDGKRIYDIISKQKVKSILREGGVERAFTGDKLYKVLNKEDNFEILSEIVGKDETLAALEAAKEFGKKKMSWKVLKTTGKYALAYQFLKHIFPILNRPIS